MLNLTGIYYYFLGLAEAVFFIQRCLDCANLELEYAVLIKQKIALNWNVIRSKSYNCGMGHRFLKWMQKPKSPDHSELFSNQQLQAFELPVLLFLNEMVKILMRDRLSGKIA
ncbi:hypothetical protein [Acinetobacter sp.]|uniref:hypothetical protein n=1 Tax=Acinetobacter sp. TaxID=472 RepID=UPI0035AF7F44